MLDGAKIAGKRPDDLRHGRDAGRRQRCAEQETLDQVGLDVAGQDFQLLEGFDAFHRDGEAERARQYFAEFQPSSPSIALLRDGEVVHFVHRHQIEGRSPQAIAADLTAAFDRHFGAAV